MNTGERKALAEEIVKAEDSIKPRRRSTDTVRTYQWAVGIILALLVTCAGAYIGLVIKNNDREHIEMKQSIKENQRAINMMRSGYPRAPGVRP